MGKGFSVNTYIHGVYFLEIYDNSRSSKNIWEISMKLENVYFPATCDMSDPYTTWSHTLTHWPLGNLNVILDLWFSSRLKWLMVKASYVKLP